MLQYPLRRNRFPIACYYILHPRDDILGAGAVFPGSEAQHQLSFLELCPRRSHTYLFGRTCCIHPNSVSKPMAICFDCGLEDLSVYNFGCFNFDGCNIMPYMARLSRNKKDSSKYLLADSLRSWSYHRDGRGVLVS